jgi:hypothetical protein
MSWQVGYREMSYPEPMLTRRNPETDIKTGGVSILREQFASELRRLCKRCPAYSGHDSVPGSSWELREPVIMMPREKCKPLKWQA